MNPKKIEVKTSEKNTIQIFQICQITGDYKMPIYDVFRYHGLFLVTACLFSCATPVSVKDVPKKDFYFVKESNERINARQEHFEHEYQQIAERRNNNGFEHQSIASPTRIIGLGLSGGGIRSAAFQLGILSGLHAQKLGDKNMLDRIDYISSVSGGSWANGAYWAWQQSDDSLFTCLDTIAKQGFDNVSSPCNATVSLLRTEQEPKVLVGPWTGQRKEQWEEDANNAYLSHSCNIRFSDKTSACLPATKRKPYPIFNTTHDAVNSNTADLQNTSFQITPDYVGTLLDPDHDNSGFFVRNDAKDFNWRNDKWMFREDKPGDSLSVTLATSSAVVGGSPLLLEYDFILNYKNKPVKGIRERIVMTDGGFTENLGLVPLIERGSNLIILSDMGWTDKPLSDLDLAKRQVKKLLCCEVSTIGGAETDMIRPLTYDCPSVLENSRAKGTILYVKPYRWNIEGFRKYLKDEKLLELLGCVDEKTQNCLTGKSDNTALKPDERFPQSPTMQTSYDRLLIRSYYLLGKYVSETYIKEEMQKWLNQQNL